MKFKADVTARNVKFQSPGHDQARNLVIDRSATTAKSKSVSNQSKSTLSCHSERSEESHCQHIETLSSLRLGQDDNNRDFLDNFFLVYDIFRFLSCLTLRKILNYGKLRISYLLSSFLKRPLTLGQPCNLAIEPTSVCNLACPECPSGNGTLTRRRGHISSSLFTKTIQQLKPYLFTTTLYFQGEPFLNPQLYSMIAHLKKHNIYSIISTHAQFLTPQNCDKLILSGLDRVIVSLDGLDQHTYARYRVGGSYQKVIDGIQNLVNAKQRHRAHAPVIILQFLVFRHNQHQLEDVKRTGKRLGVDKVSIKAPQVYDFKRNAGMIPTIPKYSRYTKNHEGHYRLKGKIKNKCWRSWQNPVVTVDGDLLPCCFDKDASHAYGNIKSGNIKNVWHNKEARKFKQAVLKNRRQHEICRNCTEGMRYLF